MIEMRQSPSRDHPAVRAWASLRREQGMPGRITILQEDPKTTVYRLEGVGPGASPIIAKRCHRATAEVERRIYQEMLVPSRIPTLHYYGYVEEPGSEYSWAFLEDAGDEEYSPLVETHRVLAARWLGAVHVAAAPGMKSHLPDRGPAHYLEHLREARRTILASLADPSVRADDARVLEVVVARCDFLERHWDKVEQFCSRMPQTLVHGDFVGKNVRVRLNGSGPALLPFDWETAGWGVPAADLAGSARIAPQVSRCRPSWRLLPLLGGCADLGIYWPVVREAWPHLHPQAIQQLANYGAVFRLLAAVSWDSWMLTAESDRAAFIRMMRVYGPWLDDAIRAVEWV